MKVPYKIFDGVFEDYEKALTCWVDSHSHSSRLVLNGGHGLLEVSGTDIACLILHHLALMPGSHADHQLWAAVCGWYLGSRLCLCLGSKGCWRNSSFFNVTNKMTSGWQEPLSCAHCCGLKQANKNTCTGFTSRALCILKAPLILGLLHFGTHKRSQRQGQTSAHYRFESLAVPLGLSECIKNIDDWALRPDILT